MLLSQTGDEICVLCLIIFSSTLSLILNLQIVNVNHYNQVFVFLLSRVQQIQKELWKLRNLCK